MRLGVLFKSLLHVGAAMPLILNAAHADPCTRMDEALSIAAAYSGRAAPKTKPRCSTVSSPEFDAHLVARAGEHEHPRRRQFDHALYSALGILAPEWPYETCFYQTPDREVVATYEPSENKVLIRNGVPLPMATLVHELVHALQHSERNLESYQSDHFLSIDSTLAALALVEGEAVVIEREAMGDAPLSEPRRRTNDRCKPPEELEKLLAFPYSHGERVFRQLDAQERKLAFHNPPIQTAELMRVARYRERLRRGVSNAPLRATVSNTEMLESLGTYLWYVALGTVVPPFDAARATVHITSDSARIVRLSSGEYEAIFSVNHASEDAAALFLETVRRWVAVRYEVPLRPASFIDIATPQGARITIRRSGTSVTITLAPIRILEGI